MDTKWKNIKYSPVTKTMAFIIVWLSVMCVAGSGLFMLYHHDVRTSKSYYDTSRFKNQFGMLNRDAVDFHVKLKNEANVRSMDAAEGDVEDNLRRYYALKGKFSRTVNYAYYLTNTESGEIFTNIPAENARALIQNQATAVKYDRWVSEPGFYDITKMLAGTPYELLAAVIEPLKPGDVFYNDFVADAKIRVNLTYAINLFVISMILMVLGFIYLVTVTGRREPGGEITFSAVDKIYADVYTVLVFIAALISMFVAVQASPSFLDPVAWSVVAVVLGLDVSIGLSYTLSMIRQVKSGQIIKNTLVYKIFDLCFTGQPFKISTLLLFLAYGAINGILFALAFSKGGFLIFFFFIVPFNMTAIYFMAKFLMSLTKIMDAAKEISAGNIDYALDKSQIPAPFAGLAGDIQSIQGGLKKAVTEAIKGERMKTELITNVSHDLKTPLTSVINYVDLLKKENLNNEKANEYLLVLDEKSARLKQLIEDLIEASKASSGSLAVNMEKIDLQELVWQAYGEYEERIAGAGLDVHINAGDEKIFISADGKHMWRVMENLLSNVLKYSLPGSRVYIDIDQGDQYGALTVKNISASPLDISPEQLTERFVRGDESRSREGSGLGLSIAQSLANIQGGRFEVMIDGDLFKVLVEMPLWV